MLRPLWWIELTGAEEGGTLEAEEAGLIGKAKILSLRDDVRVRRKLKPGGALVIGTIKHQGARVIELVIYDNPAQALGVTPPHPLFSSRPRRLGSGSGVQGR